MATEKRLIDAYTLAEEIESLQITVAGNPAKWNDAKYSVLRVIADQADVDAVEVVHGRWEPELMPTGVEYTGYAEMTVQALSCSVCGKCVDMSESYFSYCPNCGAKMDGGNNETKTD